MSADVPTNASVPAPLQSLTSRGVKIDHLLQRVKDSRKERERLEKGMSDIVLPQDTGLLVFGSLAREEWAEGGDVDWTLLLDGQADSAHMHTAREIREQLDVLEVNQPGPTGVFGGMAFSHEIVHHIGGESDTNRNTTRRVLLLLESRSIGSVPEGHVDDVRDRVLRGVIGRYIEDDFSRHTSEPDKLRIPRFLLNDIVRFWRTMAVDYASKRRERGDEGWALRNVKLRFSRKLIFVKGLLVCFGTTHDMFDDVISNTADGDGVLQRVPRLRALVDVPASQLLATAVCHCCKDDTPGKMFGAYDSFLRMLSDPGQRDRLQKLPPEKAQEDSVFKEMRNADRDFQESLIKLFFDSNEKLADYTREYGVF